MGGYGSKLEEWIVMIIRMRSCGSDGDPTVDARSKTQTIDHDLSWVCTAGWCGHISGVDTYLVWITYCIHTPAIHYPTIHTPAIHYLAIHCELSAVDHMRQEVNYIYRRCATVDLANRYAWS